VIHELLCLVSGIPGRREITADEFAALHIARQCLVELLSIEENYNGLLDRYIAMQRELITIVLHVELHSPVDNIEFHGFSQKLAREAACLLSAGRQYLDHTDHALKEIARLCGIKSLPYDIWRAHEYDTRFGYRAIEAIRNAAQHRMLPSQGISIGGGWVEDAAGRKRRHSGSLRVVPRVLGENPKFKPSVLQELIVKATKERDDSLDFMALMREHLTGVAVIHGNIRAALKEHIDAWDGVIQDTQASWRSEFGKDTALTARAREDSGVKEELQISGDHLLRRRRLALQNGASEYTFDFDVVC
jgi:hypothetical protein